VTSVNSFPMRGRDLREQPPACNGRPDAPGEREPVAAVRRGAGDWLGHDRLDVTLTHNSNSSSVLRGRACFKEPPRRRPVRPSRCSREATVLIPRCGCGRWSQSSGCTTCFQITSLDELEAKVLEAVGWFHQTADLVEEELQASSFLVGRRVGGSHPATLCRVASSESADGYVPLRTSTGLPLSGPLDRVPRRSPDAPPDPAGASDAPAIQAPEICTLKPSRL
jgi:hypothetical protein